MPVIFRDRSVLDGMTKRIDKDTYLTQYELAYATVGWLYNNTHYPYTYIQYVLDPGAGNGVWAKALRAHWRYSGEGLVITGVELRKKVQPDGYDFWHPRQDYLKWMPTMMAPDLVIGNPPFLEAEAFVEKSFSFLSPQGIICFLLPTDFTHTKGRSEGLFKQHPPRHIVSLAERPQFSDQMGRSLGKANTNNYVLGVWVNDSLDHTIWHSWSWK
jgi:hypothetical protein